VNPRSEKYQHRFHARLTKKLAQAYTSLAKAESNETLAAGMYYAHVARAKKRVEVLTKELETYESTHSEL
jgi:hypothetical protein